MEASYRTVRYSGKERDATGLYYYGFRYYVAGTQRWISPDPARTVDGLNFFAFVKGNPVFFKDVQGLNGIDVNELTSEQSRALDLNGKKLVPAINLYEAGYKFDGATVPVTYFEEVGQDVFVSLKQAHLANFIAKVILIKGSPNQVLDLWRSPFTPRLAARTLEFVRSLQRNRSLEHVVKAGVGNCGEHAQLTFNLLSSVNTNEPVFLVSAGNGVDHAFTIIGDPRVLPLSKIVIVDAWPTFPRAHMADVGTFNIGALRDSAPMAADPKYSVDDEFLLRNSRVAFPDQPSLSRKAEINSMGGGYLQLFSLAGSRIGLDYKSEGVRGGFNKLPKRYVVDRVRDFSSFNRAQ
ncbi:hypothetical protein D3C87_1276720 [compost metagenome]